MPRTDHNRHGDRASRDDDPPHRTRNVTVREPVLVATVKVYFPGLSVRPFTRRPRVKVREPAFADSDQRLTALAQAFAPHARCTDSDTFVAPDTANVTFAPLRVVTVPVTDRLETIGAGVGVA